jgi:hypothetical protein
MGSLSKLFSLLLKLYPPAFYERFAVEMEDVFQEGLAQAVEQRNLVRFCLRELLHLPANLINTYAWSIRASLEGQPVVSGGNGSGSNGVHLPGESWGNSIMAGLPHLLIFIFILLTLLFNSMLDANQNEIATPLLVIFCLLIAGAGILSIVKGWKRWSTSWVIYLLFIILALASSGATSLGKSLHANFNILNAILILILPLVLAYVIYKISCRDRLHGLMAAILPTVIMWAYFTEFVPQLPINLAWAWSFLLGFVATVLINRVKRFIIALGAAMAVPILAGFPFAYLSVYLGGSLPFTEPGPSLQEAFRQYLPFVTMSLTFILAPQLAVKLRQISPQIAGSRGKIFYRVVFGGLLLGFAFDLYRWGQFQNTSLMSGTIQWVLAIIAIILYIGGFASLFWVCLNNKLPSIQTSQLVQLSALFILLLCVPFILILPTQAGLEGFANRWIPILFAIAWVCASVWIARE